MGERKGFQSQIRNWLTVPDAPVQIHIHHLISTAAGRQLSLLGKQDQLPRRLFDTDRPAHRVGYIRAGGRLR